jgi:hypothetical protein
MGNKMELIQWSSELPEKAIEFTKPDIMLKIVATIDSRGWPHLTIITSNRVIAKDKVAWGQFTIGMSKKNILENPKQGIIYMTGDMPFKILQLKAKFSHIETDGEDIDYFNNTKLMRYFTYLNIFKVYYGDVVAALPIRKLPLGGIFVGILKSMIGKGGAKTNLSEKRLNMLGYKLFKGPINPKFIAYVDPSDGYPVIVPCIQLTAPDHNRLIFPPSALKEDLEAIPVDSKVAVLSLNLDLAGQLVKGTFIGFKKFRKIRFGVIEIEEIYNSVPPLPGVYYPKLSIRQKVTDFHL